MSTIRLPAPLVIVAVASVLLVTGCARPAANAPSAGDLPISPSPTSTSIEPADPSPTPSASLPPLRLPDQSNLVATPGGLGSLRIGTPVADTDMVVYDAHRCDEIGYFPPGDDRNGRWIANYPSDGNLDLFEAHVGDDGLVQLIGLRSSSIPTEAGIRIGSTVEELKAAYPNLQVGAASDLSTLHYIEAEGGQLTFETIDAIDYWPEYAGRVFDIRIRAAAGTPTTIVAATDNTVSGCI